MFIFQTEVWQKKGKKKKKNWKRFRTSILRYHWNTNTEFSRSNLFFFLSLSLRPIIFIFTFDPPSPTLVYSHGSSISEIVLCFCTGKSSSWLSIAVCLICARCLLAPSIFISIKVQVFNLMRNFVLIEFWALGSVADRLCFWGCYVVFRFRVCEHFFPQSETWHPNASWRSSRICRRTLLPHAVQVSFPIRSHNFSFVCLQKVLSFN